MGYDVGRFQGEVDEELMCSICGGVLEDPLQAPSCEHAFCASCIHEWLNHQQSCPIDRRNLTPLQLKQVPRILKNLLSKLLISCDNNNFGCDAIVRLDSLNSHLSQCQHNPKRPIQCEKGCGLVVPFDELLHHNCVRELNVIIQNQNLKLVEVQSQIDDQRQQLNEQKREIQALKDMMRAVRVLNIPQALPPVPDDHVNQPALVHQSDELREWILSLPQARVTRWGGMISTPDAVLQAVIRRALSDSGCPATVISELMENAHERRWPPGLSTLETRQINRRRYEQYICRRIAGKQAVIIMSCENEHMGEALTLDPGIVMIFAHGIE
ncbi:E3 ubiquitin-protein ligase NRDP1 [Exaiptasia diaphana]|uniref:E3 ubiquitin-protein ligase NRDP1 n=1 Tax=Exaiptasia diaphana TaxID=2652724 RepID=A0A913WRW1_EXADI|nr:E3 ubiquitin-protein ligase NRDP1 [Exaiptasia diaphana]KXJ28033.1 E3 ubiquitin-protein ligase NRDP1 [Exaiptasia diaphana]